MLSGPIEHSPYSYVHLVPGVTVLHSAIVIVAGAGGLPCGPGGFSCVGGLQAPAPVAPAVAATRTNGVMKDFRVRIPNASKSRGVIESRTAMGAIASEMDFVWKVSKRYAAGELDEARGGPATWLGKKIG